MESDSRKITGRFGSRNLPTAFAVRLNTIRGLIFGFKEPHHWQVRLFDDRIFRPGKCPMHVRLSGTHPNLTDKNILDVDSASVGTGHLQDGRVAGGWDGFKRCLPVAVGAGGCFDFLIAERNRHAGFSRGLTPDRCWLALLQDHVVGDRCGQGQRLRRLLGLANCGQ